MTSFPEHFFLVLVDAFMIVICVACGEGATVYIIHFMPPLHIRICNGGIK